MRKAIEQPIVWAERGYYSVPLGNDCLDVYGSATAVELQKSWQPDLDSFIWRAYRAHSINEDPDMAKVTAGRTAINSQLSQLTRKTPAVELVFAKLVDYEENKTHGIAVDVKEKIHPQNSL